MKRILSIVLILSVLSLLAPTIIYADENVDGTYITVELDPFYSDATHGFCQIIAYYYRSDLDKDPFVKKSWIRVDSIDEGADLKAVYMENADKENIIEYTFQPGGNRIRVSKSVSLNGTYIFCGWSEEAGDEPDYIESIDVTNIKVPRAMIYMSYESSNDLGQEYIGNIVINKIDCTQGTSIKRYVLAKYYELPPGSLPNALPPDQRDQYYDEIMEKYYDKYSNTYLCIQNVENPMSINDIKYPIKENGSYILITEDTNGKYSFQIMEVDDGYEYLYDIMNISIKTENGEYLTDFPENQSFIVNMEVHINHSSDADYYFCIAVYDTNDALLSFDSEKANVMYESEFKFNIPAQSAEIGCIKAFVWSSFTSTEPLAETKTLTFPLTNE